MILAIDASNIRTGGGVTHLVELLNASKPIEQGIEKVIIWASSSVLNQIEDQDWLLKGYCSHLDKSLPFRLYWQKFILKKLLFKNNCDLLFVPGGSFAIKFSPIVTMSQNMLPFEWEELSRYGFSLLTIKFLLLRFTQSLSFKKADGVIFLTTYARKGVEKITGKLKNTAVIPHGLNERFIMQPKLQKDINTYSGDEPFRIIYVSKIDQYKHQWHVINAIAKLRKMTGWSLILELIGPDNPKSMKRFQKSIQRYDKDCEWVIYHGSVPFGQLHEMYQQADLGLFASSCENMPNILLETMASGLPVASSNRGPMPEILGDTGVYFNPEDPEEIANVLKKIIADLDLRKELVEASFKASQQYSWERCANETFNFLAKNLHNFNKNIS